MPFLQQGTWSCIVAWCGHSSAYRCLAFQWGKIKRTWAGLSWKRLVSSQGADLKPLHRPKMLLFQIYHNQCILKSVTYLEENLLLDWFIDWTALGIEKRYRAQDEKVQKPCSQEERCPWDYPNTGREMGSYPNLRVCVLGVRYSQAWICWLWGRVGKF